MALGDLFFSAWGVENPGKLKAPPALLTWKLVNEKMPWNIILLLGGGFALAKGSEVRASHPLPSLLEGHSNCLCPTEGKHEPHLGGPTVGRTFTEAGGK